MKHIFTPLFALLFFCNQNFAQTQISHITSQVGDKDANPSDFVELNGKLLFEAFHESFGREIWVMDNRDAEAKLLKDIAPGANSCTFHDLASKSAKLGNELFFCARDGRSSKLWKTDGTTEGTLPIKDFSFNYLRQISQMGPYIYFSILENEELRLWRSDGTTAGTIAISDDLNQANVLRNQYVLGNKLIFTLQAFGQADTELWVSDGTSVGTFRISEEITSLGINWSEPGLSHVIEFQGELYFVGNSHSLLQGTGIMKTDGTISGTELVKSGMLATSLIDYGDAIELNGKLYFSFYQKNNKRLRVWESDGSENGTKKILDQSSSTYFDPSNLWKKDGLLAFAGPSTQLGTALFTYNPATGIFEEVVKLSDEEASPRFIKEEHICWIQDYSDEVIFVSVPGLEGFESYREGWLGNLSISSTSRLEAFDEIGKIFPYQDRQFFAQRAEEFGAELYKIDPLSSNKPTIHQNINTSGYGLNHIYNLVSYRNAVYFPANDGIHGSELWRYNRISGKTSLFHDVYPGPESGVYALLSTQHAIKEEKFFFVGRDSTHEAELWRTDGHTTRKIENVNPNSFASYPSGLSSYQGFEIVSAYYEGKPSLCKLNDTKMQLLRTYYTRPTSLRESASGVYFVTSKDAVIKSLGKSRGTTGSTILLDDFIGIKDVEVVNEQVFMQAAHDSHRESELWVNNGERGGSRLVKDIGIGYSSNPDDFFDFNGKLAFTATTEEFGRELWLSDGTESGTFMIKDMAPGTASSVQSNNLHYTVLGDRLYFVAEDGEHGPELWSTDGSEAGTFMVKDINEGSFGSFPSGLTSVDDRIYFQAFEPEHGAELWVTDGENAGTKLVADIYPGEISSSPIWMKEVGHELFFGAESAAKGRQLWKIDIEGRSPSGIFVDELTIYPNPASSYLYLGNPLNPLSDFSYQIIDLTGRKVKEEKEVNIDQIYIGDLAGGQYILHIQTADKQYSTKINLY